jgi:DNA mismatch repair protein MutS
LGVYNEDYGFEVLTKHFQTNSLKGFGIEELQEGIVASGAVLYYLSETQHNKIQHITSIQRIAEDAYVWMDRFTIRNLELYHSHQSQCGYVLDVIDKTLSPMGSFVETLVGIAIKRCCENQCPTRSGFLFKGKSRNPT